MGCFLVAFQCGNISVRMADYTEASNFQVMTQISEMEVINLTNVRSFGTGTRNQSITVMRFITAFMLNIDIL